MPVAHAEAIPDTWKTGYPNMSQRETNLLWLKDTLEHLRECRNQLEWTDDAETVEVLTETMIRDLDCCRGLCEGLRRRVKRPQVA